MEYYLPIKKKWYNAICGNVDGPGDHHTKWRERERQMSYGITYMQNLLKNDTNEFIYKTEIRLTNLENEL